MSAEGAVKLTGEAVTALAVGPGSGVSDDTLARLLMVVGEVALELTSTTRTTVAQEPGVSEGTEHVMVAAPKPPQLPPGGAVTLPKLVLVPIVSLTVTVPVVSLGPWLVAVMV